jgi:enoyl-CoA hydratase/carnithine racemase
MFVHPTIVDLEADPSVKVVVFQSANPDFFIAPLDVSKAAERPEVLGLWREFVLRLSSTPIVSIAKIRGRTRGIGNEFVLACDMRFAVAVVDSLRAESDGASVPHLVRCCINGVGRFPNRVRAVRVGCR